MLLSKLLHSFVDISQFETEILARRGQGGHGCGVGEPMGKLLERGYKQKIIKP